MARLLSVNVGLPRDVPWRGETVHTGVYKSPVLGPRRVRRLNIDGDGQGDLRGHGGEMRAVLVYQADSYRHWAAHLGRDDLVHGNFGENFTVEGLPDDEVCVGDRYRIGTAVFEVTQPRVTCYRVGLRMGEPRLPALLVSHGRPGFYLRVIDEGVVAAGQEIVKVADGPERMTVAEIDALLYRPPHPADRLERALRVEALSPGWQASFRALLDQARGEGARPAGNAGLSPVPVTPPAWDGFRPLRVQRVVDETPYVRSLWLTDPDGTPLPAARPGQYLTLRAGEAPGTVRSYSLSGRPGAPGYRISVKREEHGRASTWLHTGVRAGDDLQAAAPRGAFVLQDLREDTLPVVFVSAGVGVTPLLAMLHALADDADAPRHQVWWLHATRNERTHAFAGEVRRLLARLPGARLRVFYSRPEPAARLAAGTTAGRLTADTVARLGLPGDAQAYVCGPDPFMRDVTAALRHQGTDPHHIHTEIFGVGPGSTPGIADRKRPSPHSLPSSGPGPRVEFARSQVSATWNGDHDSLLELAEACDVPTRWSCRTGVCRTCETALMSGAVDYTTEPVEQPPPGSALICCSRPARDVVLDL
ncbi:MOSC and FAD-binding oxidoreductase domain-containing protein [Streptomyces sp. PAL114]|uniref:MOSC and FAD-binding oxidoreductase domain-containing protein n=1 Tax=Streptomyces sp. PAL114 TaxID=2970893 RepID=UPI0028FD7EFD|nr:MOSC and FAD-binding oxidoreductase domain-containing protein [Streptomyces sp. PAL114]MDU0302050.1 MOSC and FAD-binding oxidoreductase domain-containing protein [Streptomyces sp. PAL114]